MSDCKFHWRDEKRTALICSVHPDEAARFVKPADQYETVKLLQQAGEWDRDADPGPPKEVVATGKMTGTAKPVTPTVEPARELVEYESIAGIGVSLTVKGFQELICRDANAQQALFMISWCQHNRIDPFSNEAHFAIMDNKPVIQVSKDAWFKRMEAHPDFISHDSGILVRAHKELLRVVALVESDDYLLNDAFLASLIGPAYDALPEQLTVKKRGQFVDEGEELVGGWASIVKRNRPAPVLFQIPLKGWELKKAGGELNIFWQTKASFMIWKTALKNAARLAFPDLSGLLSVPEFDLEETDETPGRLREVPSEEDLESTRKTLLKELHAAGNAVPPPHGPFTHLDLHHLAVRFFSVDSLARCTIGQLSDLIANVTSAQTSDLQADYLSVEIRVVSPRVPSNLSVKRTRTSDEMGV